MEGGSWDYDGEQGNMEFWGDGKALFLTWVVLLSLSQPPL